MNILNFLDDHVIGFNIARAQGNGTERPMPSRVPPKTLGQSRIYVLSLNPGNGDLNPYFKSRPQTPDPSGDGQLEIRVVEDAQIIIELDEKWNWEFRDSDAVMMITPTGQTVNPASDPYFNLLVEVINGKRKRATFTVLFASGGTYGHTDAFNIYVDLTQTTSGDVITINLRIDPDIKNPGDHN